ncbi:MAG: ABC transporter ATP-binding protein/permease [Defluviitaleaceae bacterium]|nr:ABC transporter ATP-binding protein/permease [Defluviitaleaceae bacterium]
MFRKFLKLIKPEKKKFIASIIAALLAACFVLMAPLVIKFILDYVLPGVPADDGIFLSIANALGGIEFLRQNIWICAVAIIFIALGQASCAFLRGRFAAIGAENISRAQKDMLYNHMQKLPYDYHVKAKTGDIIQRCTTDVETVRRFIATQFMEIFRIAFAAVIAFGLMLTFHVGLAFVSVMFVPVIFYSAYKFSGVISSSWQEVEHKEGELSTVMQENFTGVRVVRAFGREEFELNKFDVRNKDFKDLTYKHLIYIARFWGVSDFLCFLQIAAVLCVSVYFAYNGAITLGTVVVFMSYVNNLVWPLRQLARIVSDMNKMDVSMNRINEIMFTPAEESGEGATTPDLKGDIVFRNVDFAYEKAKPILNSISFTVKKGEKIAVLGSTGSGKSSLMHLLLRLYDYEKGSITLNGNELRRIDKSYLRKKVGIVLQDTFLYSKSIMENIKMAKDVVEDSEVYDAAKVANIHSDIENFKDGYKTMVGERGVTLSGGQKQRVAIARTLVKNSDILIFDDSLSAVDTETDALIQAELKKKGEGVTTFIISQRITTLMGADKILVMEGGKITDAGTHDELISREGLYYKIWNIQNDLEEEFEREG